MRNSKIKKRKDKKGKKRENKKGRHKSQEKKRIRRDNRKPVFLRLPPHRPRKKSRRGAMAERTGKVVFAVARPKIRFGDGVRSAPRLVGLSWRGVAG